MSTTVPKEPDRTEGAPLSLGDLLYANKDRAYTSETEWQGLVHAIASQDQQAFRELYRRSYRIVFTLIMRIVGDRHSAEEVTLDVFHGVWRRASEYTPEGGPVLGWILNQARSKAIDRLRFEQRKKRATPPAGAGLAAEAAPGCDATIDLDDQSRFVRHALTVLTPAERAVIECAFFGELSYAEVALRLQAPIGTVKTRIRSALQKLRTALNAETVQP